MAQLKFQKYQGAGNDFVIFQGNVFENLSASQIENFIKNLCHRRFGVGADGVITILEAPSPQIFEMGFYNSDGLPGSFCGNGARCAARFAIDHGMTSPDEPFSFSFADNTYLARPEMNDQIGIKFANVGKPAEVEDMFFVDTGSPHIVIENLVNDKNALRKKALEIRHSDRFAEKGVNVNFTERGRNGEWNLVTFERGVEDFTWACGTGAVGTAIYLMTQKGEENPYLLRSPGGLLTVELGNGAKNTFDPIWLSGPASSIFEGSVDGPD
ncbi:MAG: diaminopimelate epimerase [Saprospirales bacterium]|nr:MAG: diaminopimelate epimerase [Saprospirales bacterium]